MLKLVKWFILTVIALIVAAIVFVSFAPVWTPSRTVIKPCTGAGSNPFAIGCNVSPEAFKNSDFRGMVGVVDPELSEELWKRKSTSPSYKPVPPPNGTKQAIAAPTLRSFAARGNGPDARPFTVLCSGRADGAFTPPKDAPAGEYYAICSVQLDIGTDRRLSIRAWSLRLEDIPRLVTAAYTVRDTLSAER